MDIFISSLRLTLANNNNNTTQFIIRFYKNLFPTVYKISALPVHFFYKNIFTILYYYRMNF
jgi:hypothetical protein